MAFAAAKSLTELGNPAGQTYMVKVLKGETKTVPGMMTNAERDARKNMLHPQNLILTGAAGAAGIAFPPAGLGLAAARQAEGDRAHGGGGRVQAAAAISKQNTPVALNALEGALKDSNPAVQTEAAKGLGDLGNPSSVDKLIPLLSDSHTRVRTMAAASIIRLTH